MSQFVTLNREMKDDYHYNEAIKTLRTNIQFCGSGIKTIMLTSSLPDEGKSDITFAMASSLAQIGKKVVMIKMPDIPQIRSGFPLSAGTGGGRSVTVLKRTAVSGACSL